MLGLQASEHALFGLWRLVFDPAEHGHVTFTQIYDFNDVFLRPCAYIFKSFGKNLNKQVTKKETRDPKKK